MVYLWRVIFGVAILYRPVLPIVLSDFVILKEDKFWNWSLD